MNFLAPHLCTPLGSLMHAPLVSGAHAHAKSIVRAAFFETFIAFPDYQCGSPTKDSDRLIAWGALVDDFRNFCLTSELNTLLQDYGLVKA